MHTIEKSNTNIVFTFDNSHDRDELFYYLLTGDYPIIFTGMPCESNDEWKIEGLTYETFNYRDGSNNPFTKSGIYAKCIKRDENLKDWYIVHMKFHKDIYDPAALSNMLEYITNIFISKYPGMNTVKIVNNQSMSPFV